MRQQAVCWCLPRSSLSTVFSNQNHRKMQMHNQMQEQAPVSTVPMPTPSSGDMRRLCLTLLQERRTHKAQLLKMKAQKNRRSRPHPASNHRRIGDEGATDNDGELDALQQLLLNAAAEEKAQPVDRLTKQNNSNSNQDYDKFIGLVIEFKSDSSSESSSSVSIDENSRVPQPQHYVICQSTDTKANESTNDNNSVVSVLSMGSGCGVNAKYNHTVSPRPPAHAPPRPSPPSTPPPASRTIGTAGRDGVPVRMPVSLPSRHSMSTFATPEPSSPVVTKEFLESFDWTRVRDVDPCCKRVGQDKGSLPKNFPALLYLCWSTLLALVWWVVSGLTVVVEETVDVLVVTPFEIFESVLRSIGSAVFGWKIETKRYDFETLSLYNENRKA